MTAPPPLPVAAAPYLSAENLRQLSSARAASRKVRRAIAVASFDGWSIGVFGGLTLLFGLTDFSSIALGLGMGVVAFIELRGAGRLRRLEAGAARTLGFNQVALGTMLILYATWHIVAQLTGPSPYQSIKSSDAQLAHMLQPIEDLSRMLTIAIYSAVIAIAFFAQGGLALFYFTRDKHLRDYLSRTPDWILTMQRSGIAF